MSTGVLEEQRLEDDLTEIETLLNLLNIDILKRSHKSVLLSFKQMLDYVDKVRQRTAEDLKAAENATEDSNHKEPIAKYLKPLFDTYRTLAQRYYVNFECSLLEEIKAKRDLLAQVGTLIGHIGDETENNKLVRDELVERESRVIDEQDGLIKEFPSLLQDALDKLRDEWQRLDTIAVSSQTDEELIQVLNRVIAFAAYSVGIEGKRIIVVPGRQLALYFFSYLEDFAVLTVPIYSVKAPWDWSIFWHELAGYQVRELGREKTIRDIREKLVKIALETKSEEREEILSILTNGINAASMYLQAEFDWNDPDPRDGAAKDKEPDLKDLGGLEYQFDRIVAQLPPKERITIYDYMKTRGWCADWIKELFEDAFSVLTFRFKFIEYFDDILGRYGGSDGRHPPKEIRIGVARELLSRAGFDAPADLPMETDDESQSELSEEKKKEKRQEEKVIKQVALQIFRFISLVLAASRYKTAGSMRIKDQIYVQQKYPPNYLRDSLDNIEEWITTHIKEWSESIKSIFLSGTSRELSEKEKETFLSKDVREFIDLIRMDEDHSPDHNRNSLELIKDKNYQQLLALSFYDVDYHAPGDIELLESGRQYWVKPTDWNSSAWGAQRRRHFTGNSILQTQTIVTEIRDGSLWAVNKMDWNTWFKMTQ